MKSEFEAVLKDGRAIWTEERDILGLAGFLRNELDVPGALKALEEVTGEPGSNIMAIANWIYFGGRQSDAEILHRVGHWAK
ncbi:hypothetical protein [Deinococcus sp.]|uniref:hypothetical protein n=1 Tax=Deinococcus sp. TaxID=47478 RepID=UPI0025ED9552|nr:hypothetical protein [Deinococcus sp.]